MGKIIVTGSNGFIGEKLTKKFIENGKNVIALDISEKPNIQSPLLTYYRTDFINDSLNFLYNKNEIDAIYHTAWIGVNADHRRNLAIQTNNIIVNNKILELCKVVSSKRNFFLGSASEYATSKEPISEHSCFSPIEAYGATKAACHLLSESFSKEHNIPLNWLVISSIYGPGRDDNNIITYAIKSLLNQEYPLFTSLDQLWDYIYIDDLINILALLLNLSKPTKTYFIGSGERKCLREYIQLIHNSIDTNLPIGIGELPYKSKQIDNCILDVTEVFKDTNYQLEMSLKDGIAHTINYFKGIAKEII